MTKLPIEENYEFRKRMLCVHKRNLRNKSLKAEENELEITNGSTIALQESCGDVMLTAAKDFTDYLFTSMNVSSMIVYATEGSIVMCINPDIDADYIIEAGSNIKIQAKNERAGAQALYLLEDKMTQRRAPFINKEIVKNTFLYSPRMVHSGYGLDMYPDEHLSMIAHSGMDAIIVFVKDINETPCGFLDFNELIYRSAKYGIDVYAYSYLVSNKHPEDDDAQEFYDNLYGELFRRCPGLKGVVLVGESVEFPSKDEHVSDKFYYENTDEYGLPTGKPSAGWWPCCDYPAWLDRVKKSVRKYRKDADIVFWTYNWGYVAEEERLKLIRSLPTDISLMATYEMFEKYQMGTISQTCADYTLSFAGPGKYFASEAEEAKKRGIRMYAMTNTGGLTWDMGTIPYEPMPQQWMKRYEGMRKANEEWGLCGTMESHHFGFWPSFISDLAKKCFVKENTNLRKNLEEVLSSHYGEKNTEIVSNALSMWSEAITHYTPTDADQYGAFRVGPSFPFCLIKQVKPWAEKHAYFGNGIMEVIYPADYSPTNALPPGRGTFPFLRLGEEMKSLKKMLHLMQEGTEMLLTISAENRNKELLYLINLGKFMCCYVKTGLNAKKWYLLKSQINTQSDASKILLLAKKIKELGIAEIKNAEEAIEYVRYDSRLGWEPSMEYMCDEKRIEWKIKHLEYVLDYELGCYIKNV